MKIAGAEQSQTKQAKQAKQENKASKASNKANTASKADVFFKKRRAFQTSGRRLVDY